MPKYRIFIIFLSLMLIFAMSGCADQDDQEEKAAPTQTEAEAETENNAEQDERSTDTSEEGSAQTESASERQEKTEGSDSPKVAGTQNLTENTASQSAGSSSQEQNETPSQPPVQAEEPIPVPSENEVASKTAEKINALRLKQGSPAVTILPGLTRVATLRSEQLITNFSHESNPDACTVLKYGEFVDMSQYGMPESSYYQGYNREAIAKGTWSGTANEIAEKIANGFRNSSGHWSYVGNSEYGYMAVGVTYNAANSTWYCCVCMSSKNYGG